MRLCHVETVTVVSIPLLGLRLMNRLYHTIFGRIWRCWGECFCFSVYRLWLSPSQLLRAGTPCRLGSKDSLPIHPAVPSVRRSPEPECNPRDAVRNYPSHFHLFQSCRFWKSPPGAARLIISCLQARRQTDQQTRDSRAPGLSHLSCPQATSFQCHLSNLRGLAFFRRNRLWRHDERDIRGSGTEHTDDPRGVGVGLRTGM